LEPLSHLLNPAADPAVPVKEEWADAVPVPQQTGPSSRLANLKGSQGGKNYSHTGGINSSFEGALFGAVDPKSAEKVDTVLHEKPVHRLMQTMFAKGYTIEEIAQHTNYTRARVGVILRQPWAQMHIVDDVKKSVRDELKEFLEGEVLPSLQIVRDLRDNPENPAAVRLAAADQILNRFLGRPNQPITQGEVDPSKLTTQELERRVSQIVAGMATQDDPPAES
jgi:hypothetical protein